MHSAHVIDDRLMYMSTKVRKVNSDVSRNDEIVL